MEQKRFPEPFKYCEYYVEDFINEANFGEVNMVGMRHTLQRLLNVIKRNFQEVSYMTYDIEYHGWYGEEVRNMHKINNELVQRMLEIYVICQMALGKEVYDEVISNE